MACVCVCVLFALALQGSIIFRTSAHPIVMVLSWAVYQSKFVVQWILRRLHKGALQTYHYTRHVEPYNASTDADAAADDT